MKDSRRNIPNDEHADRGVGGGKSSLTCGEA